MSFNDYGVTFNNIELQIFLKLLVIAARCLLLRLLLASVEEVTFE